MPKFQSLDKTIQKTLTKTKTLLSCVHHLVIAKLDKLILDTKKKLSPHNDDKTLGISRHKEFMRYAATHYLSFLLLLSVVLNLSACATTYTGININDVAVAIYVEDRTGEEARTLKIILDNDGTLSVAENVSADFIPEMSVRLSQSDYDRLAKEITSDDMNRLFRIRGGVVDERQKQTGVTYRLDRTVSGKHERIHTTHRMAQDVAPLVKEFVALSLGAK